MQTFLPVMMVGFGGMLGAMARYGIAGLVHENEAGRMHLGTLAVNLIGCLLMGILVRWLEVRGNHSVGQYFLGMGVLGGFTTFSAFSADALKMCCGGAFSSAVWYVLASMIGCLIAVGIGYQVAVRIWVAG